MSRTHQHTSPPLGSIVLFNTLNTCEFSMTWWWLYSKIESTHQILCTKIRIPIVKGKIPPVQKIPRAEFGTFPSLLSFKKNCVTVSFLRILILNRTFSSDKRINKITKKCRKQRAIWRFEKIINTVPFDQFSCWKKCWQAQTFICVYKLLQHHETQCIMGKIHFRKVSWLHRVWEFRLSMTNNVLERKVHHTVKYSSYFEIVIYMLSLVDSKIVNTNQFKKVVK